MEHGILASTKIYVIKLLVLLVKLMAAVCAAWLVSLWAIPVAFAERGYRAVGGEWLLILFVGAFTYCIINHWLTVEPKEGGKN